MKYMHSEWRSRLEHWSLTLRNDFYLPLGPIPVEGHLTMDYLTPEQAMTKEFVPMAPGTKWGKTWEYCWMRGKVTLPPEAQGKRIVMNLVTGYETTVFVDGVSFGTYRSDWVRIPHHYMVDNYLTTSGEPGRTYDVLLEAYAGHYIAESPLGGCATGPILPGSYQDPKVEGQRQTLGEITYGIWNEDAYQLAVDVEVLKQLLEEVDDTSLRADKIAKALEQFTLVVDFEQPLEDRIVSYRKGREILRTALEAKNGSTAPKFYAIGNAHLDLAWLWPMAETFRKTSRTFAAQLRLLEEYPDYRFLQSQPASYEMCKTHYPELYQRILEAHKRGQWIAEGAMYVEPDTNMSGGEALIRQVLFGKKFFKDEFGIDSQLLWLPDTFGYSAALPQILRGCDVKYLVTQKIFWSYNEGDQFPYHYFTWEGADGSKIDTFLPTSYTYRTDPSEIAGVWKNRVQKRGLDAFLLPFGYGDGGGGPCRDHIEACLREKNLEGMPQVEMASPLTFFQDMEAAGGPEHTYVGELYFSAHRGVYTSQAAVKRGNRKSEAALREAEVWATLAAAQGKAYPKDTLDTAWKTLLLNQFHDILPGSSIARVYTEAAMDHRQVQHDAAQVAAESMAILVSGDKGVTVFNSLSFDRTGLVKLPAAFANGVKTLEGEAVAVTKQGEDVFALVTVPACGALSLVPADERAAFEAATASQTPAGIVLENRYIRATLNDRGEVTSFVDKESNREYAASPMNRLLAYKDVPRLFDAWDIDSNYIDQPIALDEPVTLAIQQEKGMVASVRMDRKVLNSTMTQDIVLEADSRRLEFRTQVDWHETHRLLKVTFPVDVKATQAINEIQFGYIERPTHRSREYDISRWEVCNQRYTALCDQNHGAAVLNDCKYGISQIGNEMQLTLLRAGTCPDLHADHGHHEFTYALTAWEGTFMAAPVVEEAYAVNTPFQVVSGVSKTFNAFALDEANVFIDTVKVAEDGSGDVILRLYEAKRADTHCVLGINLPASKVALCNMLEAHQEDLTLADGCVKLHFRPFEVKTIRISK